MVGLLWLLAAVGVLGTSFDPPTWKTFLVSVDGTLPLLSPVNSKICYYFDLSQTCSGAAIGHLLGVDPVADAITWTAIGDQCDVLLDEQRLYAEGIASSVFSAAIASAASAGVTNFELMVQSWVLRVGHYPLTNTHAAFVAAVNSISDWTTVKCDGTNLLYDSATILKPDFLASADCDVLGFVYPPANVCDNPDCTLDEGNTCCLLESTNTCCLAKDETLKNSCVLPACRFKEFCCLTLPGTTCCLN